MDGGALKLDEVARAAGVSPRTVRYYIQRGLLPPPRFRGPETAYGDEHVLRLRAIRQLQAAFWPLDAIAGLLASRSERELRELADGRGVPAPRAEPEAAPPPGRGIAPAELPVTRVRRIGLAPGVVLEVDASAGHDAEQLVERVLALLAPGRRRP